MYKKGVEIRRDERKKKEWQEKKANLQGREDDHFDNEHVLECARIGHRMFVTSHGLDMEFYWATPALLW